MSKLLQNLSKLSNIFSCNGIPRKFSSVIATQRQNGANKISRKAWSLSQISPALFQNSTNPTNLISKRYLSRDALMAEIQASPYMVMRATPADYDDMLDVMWQCYFPDEPCTKALGLGKERNAVFDEHILEIMHLGLSVVARCKYNGVIVGGSINNAASPWDPDLTERYACTLADPDIRELYLFWAYVQRAPNLWKKYCTNKIFEISDLFVIHEERGRGLGCLLTDYSLQLGADSDFKLIRCDATSAFEQKACEKVDMKLEYDIPYCSYVGANNEPVISPSPPHDQSIRVYISEPHSMTKKKK